MSPFTPQADISIAGLKPFLGIPVNRDFPWQTNMAIVQTVMALKDRRSAFVYKQIVNGSIIQSVRSILAHEFLKTDCTHFFMIDSDMAWTEGEFLRVLALATKMPIVGASYPYKRFPIAFPLRVDQTEFEANEWGCFAMGGIGLGFTCVQRCVIESLAASAPRVRNEEGEAVAMIFKVTVANGELVGEDMNFFADARANGYSLWVDPSVELGHVGSHEFRGKLIDALVKKE